jgi:hypothetical protein
MTNLNLLILVTEDDSSGLSHFFQDLANLSEITKYDNINCHILYYSLKNHGNYYFNINKSRGHHMQVVPKLNMDPKEYMDLACQFLTDYYDPHSINAFVFSSHCWNFFIRPFRKNIDSLPMVQHMEKQKMKFKFILFDCCNTSCIETIFMWKSVTDYIIGCQSSCPSIGFLTQDLSKLLHSNDSWETILKKITVAFLKRNDEHTIKRDLYETDCVLLTTKYADEIPKLFNNQVFYRDQNARTQPTPKERTIFDLVTLLESQTEVTHCKEIVKWVKKTVLSYKQSKLMQTKPWAHKLHGISIILNREKVVKKF